MNNSASASCASPVLWVAAAALAAFGLPTAVLMAQPAARGAFTVAETGRSFASLQQAVDAVGAGRATIVIAPGTYRQCAVQEEGIITYMAEAPGSVVLAGRACEGKAALVLRGRARVRAHSLTRPGEELPPELRIRCRSLPEVRLKGYPLPVRPIVLDWRDPDKVPSRLFVVETGQRIGLPNKDTISVGRLATHDGRAANDVVLHHPDPTSSSRISRWHFQLERVADGMQVRQLSRGRTEVDGRPLQRGEVATVTPGSELVVAGVLHLRLEVSKAAVAAETRYGGP